MILNNKYAIGIHVMFYEIELLPLYVESLINAIKTVDNKSNIFLDFKLNLSEFFEEIDTDKITEDEILKKYNNALQPLYNIDSVNIESNTIKSDTIYTQTNYRREFNTKYSYITDMLVWGETDSLIPKECFQVWEQVKHFMDEQKTYRYVFSFSDRKMWDSSWDVTVHEDFVNVEYNDETAMEDIKMAKSPMSIEQMNEINEKQTEFNYITINHPKIDGSFLTMTSDLIRSGVNIPPCLIHNDDHSLAIMAQNLCGKNFLQIICKNILKVHARRHPRKRLYVKGENNPRGLCGDNDKGSWWKIYKHISQQNIGTLVSNSGERFLTETDFNNILKNK